MMKAWESQIRSLVLMCVAMGLVGCKTYHPMNEALEAMAGTDTVAVQDEAAAIFFDPVSAQLQGFIFYPGAGIEPAAYAPLALNLAEAGYTVAIAKFPLNLAVLAANRADDIREHRPNVLRWALGGHSLGGVMAAQYLDNHPDDEALNGLVLLAGYPSSSTNLSDRDLAVISIYATEDKLTKPSDVLNTQPLLPASTQYEEIVGGNHGQFGWYGPQDGDGVAQISRADQGLLVVDLLVDFLAGVE